MAATWDDIKLLQADLQRAQEADTSQKLSERNCVEVVNHLLKTGLLDILFTQDGKEYLTLQQLEREIKDELQVHGGRINVVELQPLLNVDLSHIEGRVSDILKHDDNLHLLHGELITEGYLGKLADEINDVLQTSGKVVLSELSRHFNLPLDFLVEMIKPKMGHQIQGHMDEGMIYTEALICRYRARIRGLFNAVTKPTAVGGIMTRENFHETLFTSVLSGLVSSHELNGVLHGRGERATFVPDIYAQSQSNWVEAFYSANGYLDFDSLARIGIEDPKGFAKRKYGQRKDVEVLQDCLIGPRYLAQLEAVLDEVEASTSWSNVVPNLPLSCSERDVELVLEKYSRKRPSLMVFGTVACSRDFMRSCVDLFKPIMVEKAKQDIATNQKFLLELAADHQGDTLPLGSSEETSSSKMDKKEERRKKAAGQSSTSKQGVQGREKKTQKIKEKGGRSSRHHHDEESEEGGYSVGKSLQFMSTDDILSVLKSHHSDAPEEFLTSTASDLFLPLKHAYQEEARKVLSDMRDRGRKGKEKSKKSDMLQSKVQELWSNAVLFGKTISLFEGFPKETFAYQTWDNTVVHLSKHLLKTICSDLVNLVVQAVAGDHMIELKDEDKDQLSQERRSGIISQLSGPPRSFLSDVCHALNGKSVDAFLRKFEALCSQDFVGIQLKRPDKKTERQILFGHCISLADQLKNQSDPAMALHLAVVLIFMKVTGSLLQAPGRVVSQVIAYLHEKHRTEISPGDFAILQDYHELVVKSFKEKRAIAKDRHDSESMEGVTDKHGEQEERGIQEASNKQGEQEERGIQEASNKQGEQEAGDKQGEQEAGDKQGEQEERGKQEASDKQEVKGEPEIEMVEEISEVETSDLATKTELMDRMDSVKETALKYMSKGGRAGTGQKSDNH